MTAFQNMICMHYYCIIAFITGFAVMIHVCSSVVLSHMCALSHIFSYFFENPNPPSKLFSTNQKRIMKQINYSLQAWYCSKTFIHSCFLCQDHTCVPENARADKTNTQNAIKQSYVDRIGFTVSYFHSFMYRAFICLALFLYFFEFVMFLHFFACLFIHVMF